MLYKMANIVLVQFQSDRQQICHMQRRRNSPGLGLLPMCRGESAPGARSGREVCPLAPAKGTDRVGQQGQPAAD